MTIDRRLILTGSLAMSCFPKTLLARGYDTTTSISRSNFKNQASAAYGRDVGASELNYAAEEYFKQYSGYSGVDKLINHYHNHWHDETYTEPDHTYKCPCCYLVLFELSRGRPLRRDFNRFYRGRNQFNWHYSVRWNSGSRARLYSLDRYARIARLRSNGRVENFSEAGFSYYEDGELWVINFDGASAHRFRTSPIDRNGVRSTPTWLKRP